MRSNALSDFVFLGGGPLDYPRIHFLNQVRITLLDNPPLQTHLGAHHGIFDTKGLRHKSEAPNFLVGRRFL